MLSRPPTAYSLPSSTARPAVLLAKVMEQTRPHWPVSGSYLKEEGERVGIGGDRQWWWGREVERGKKMRGKEERMEKWSREDRMRGG